jgi:hypothetical protein
MNVAVPEQCATSPAGAGSRGCPFVATSLEFWFTAEPERLARDCQVDDTMYRRLDPDYYAWLRSRMTLAKKAANAGQLDAAAFEVLRLRFNIVHDWAVSYFAEEQLLAAVRTLRAADYGPPVAEHDGRHVPLPGARKSAASAISAEAIATVDSISEQALSLGWKSERLYGAGGHGVFDLHRGLVCFLKPGDMIGEVAAQSIVIIHPLPSGVRHRFYNPDVEQPWIRRVR